MTKGKIEVRSWRLALSLFVATTAPAGLALAADPTPPPEAAPAAAPTAMPPVAPPTAAVPSTPPAAAAPAAPAAVLTPPPSAAPPPDLKKIDMGFALRVGSALQGSTDTSKLNDFGLNEFTLEARFSGNLTEIFAWQANFNAGIPTATGGAGSNGVANVLDLIAKFEPGEAFHLWAGRMLVPSDRSNFSGPWFMSPWAYPGLYPGLAFPLGPKQGPFGRNDGVTAWGQFAGGKAKYYASAFDLNDASVSPMYSGRLNFCLLGSEPGFYHSSTYYGSQDIVAIGLGGQYQKNGSGPDNNLGNVMADLLAEKSIPGTGTLTLEAQYYHFDAHNFIPNADPMVTTGFSFKQAYYVLGSYLTPNKIGIGKLQALVRFQQAMRNDDAAGTPPSFKMIDGYLTYLVDDYFLRAALGYVHTDEGNSLTSNAITLGIQMQR